MNSTDLARSVMEWCFDRGVLPENLTSRALEVLVRSIQNSMEKSSYSLTEEDVEMYEWITHPEADTKSGVCARCEELSGRIFASDDFPEQPLHPHCACTKRRLYQ